MSGHSKWSQIKHKKAATDAKRGALFAKLSRALSIAAKDNPDPGTNHRLRDAIQRARAENMPNENIERAIKKMSSKDASLLSEVRIELYGPGDTAVLVHAISDNTNRTISEIRTVASSFGGRFVDQGTLSWMFRRMVLFRVRPEEPIESQQLTAIDAGAEEVHEEEEGLFVSAPLESSETVRAVLGNTIIESTVQWVAQNYHTLSEHDRGTLHALQKALEAHDDVQEVTTNAIE